MAVKSNKIQSPSFFIKGILSGDMATLSRAITLVESTSSSHQVIAKKVLEGILKKTGKSFRLGISGVPGVGKSTFIESFGKVLVKKGHKLAVLTVDPSSSKSKGSILGDKTRMEELSTMKNVYIRPSPSSGTLGGVARATYETILLCEAAGFDFVIVETVGVGQSEIAVSGITDFFLLLMLAGAGDELQGIKRGIMEIADSVVITKADGKNIEKAKAAKVEFARAMHFLQLPDSGFSPKVEVCSSIENTGISEIYDLINKYKHFAVSSNYFQTKRKQQQFQLLLNIVNEQVKASFYGNKKIAKKLEQIKNKKEIIPFTEATNLVKSFLSAKK